MDELKKEGWHINESSVAELFPDGKIPNSKTEVLKIILDEDLRNFGEPSIINLHQKEQFRGPCVLQLLRYRNVSIPKIKDLEASSSSSAVIRLFLTDGHTSISALLLEPIAGINADTAPGTKFLLTGSKIHVENGIFMMLTKNEIKILGGRVEELIEKWNIEKSTMRASGKARSGAPKWVSFGKMLKKGGAAQTSLKENFKANDVMPKNAKDGEESDEFAKNREKMLETLKQDEKKQFAKPNLEHLEPPAPKEPVQRAPKEPKPRREQHRRGRKNSEDGPDVDLGEYANHRPSGAVTLFDFIGGEAAEQMERLKVAEEPKGASRESFGKNERRGFQQDNRSPRDAPRPSRNVGGAQKGHAHHQQPKEHQRSGPNQEPRGKKTPNRSGPSGAPQQSHQNAPRNQHHQNQNPRGNYQAPPTSGQYQNTNKPRGNYQAPPASSGSKQAPPTSGRGNQAPPTSGHQHPNKPHGNYQAPPTSGQYQNPNKPRGNYQAPPTFSGDQRQNPRGNYQAPPPSGHYQNQNPRGNYQAPPTFAGLRPNWQVGNECLATWTDGAIYPATILDIQTNGMCSVRYNDYGNVHTLPIDFLIIP